MGSGASTIPEQVDYETFKALAGDRFSQDVWDSNVDSNGTIPRNRLIELDTHNTPVKRRGSTNVRSLDSLSVDDVVDLFTYLAIPSAEDLIRNSSIDGSALSRVINESDLNKVGLKTLPIVKKKILLAKIQDMKQKGVQIDKFASPTRRGSNQGTPLLDSSFDGNGGGDLTLEEVITGISVAVNAGSNAGERALDSIPRFVGEDPERHFLIGTAPGVADNVIAIIRHNITMKSICFKGLVTIKFLCRYGSLYATTCEETVDILSTHGACELVVAAMNSFLTVAAVAEAGCWSIRNLSANNENNKIKLGRAGACEAVIASIRNHLTTRGVIEAGFWAVQNLAVNDENRIRLGDNGACEVILRALQEPSNQNILSIAEQGCEAILNLAHNNEINKNRLGSDGACDVVIQSLRSFIQEPTVAENACGAILNLCHSNENNKIKLGVAGACEAVVEAIRVHMAVPEVIEQACGAILNLSFYGDNKAKLRTVGAKKLMQSLMDDQSQTEGARYWAKSSFQNLS